MRILFRVDASLEIGTGHVMRCLTLADALAARGVDCEFICREHVGNLIDLISLKGYEVHKLPNPELLVENFVLSTSGVKPIGSYLNWLGVMQSDDANNCRLILETRNPDWLIVDHYALDAEWESKLIPHCRNLMVIDDLANRPHVPSLLLDQTFGREPISYSRLVPSGCRLICGSKYALLRSEFSALRSYSLQRRGSGNLQNVLINFGGVDKDNITLSVLRELRNSVLPIDCTITVVMGSTSPWLNQIYNEAEYMPWKTQVLVGVTNMAEIMADSDLAIGAAGTTSWERCCLGLPTIMFVLSDNQTEIAKELNQFGAAYLFDITALGVERLINAEHLSSTFLDGMSRKAANVTDGLGVELIAEILTNRIYHAN